ncbi:MAG: glycoside hydrolase family 3 protein, partial [bacterium]
MRSNRLIRNAWRLVSTPARLCLCGFLVVFALRLDAQAQPLVCDVTGDADVATAEIPRRTAVTLLADGVTTFPPLREPDMVWVENTLSSMTLDEKIGQLIVTSYHSSGESLIDQYKVGGFVFLGNNQLASDIVSTVNRLQNYSKYPLWFSIDAEAGLGARLADATKIPLIMGVAAAQSPELTEQCGRLTAEECRALGVQVAYAPVVDVNTEPINPIISTRSYSDDPSTVTTHARAFIAGARSEGLLTTFKHYPGHGATTGDSHSSLPTVSLPMETLQAVHIKPYRDLVGTGDVDLVMTAHVWYSQVDTQQGVPWPATLSPIFLKDVLRTSIGFTGPILSDSYGMQGLALAVPDESERAVVGIETGLDVILNPPDVGLAFTGIKNAVLSQRITQERINESVRRILIVKSRSGLPENKNVDPNLYPSVLQTPAHVDVVRQVCERGFTRGKNTISEPPISSSDKVLVLSLNASSTIFYRLSSSYFTTPFLQTVDEASVTTTVSTRVSSATRQSIINLANTMDKVVILG